MKNAFRIIKCLPWSILFNFHYLPWRKAVKLPILFETVPTFLCLKGNVRIASEHISTGMIRFGGRFAPFERRKNVRWQNVGTITFAGNAYFGHHVFISVGENAELYIGADSTFSHNVKIISEDRISLGDKCRVSWDCIIIDTDFHPLIDMVRNKPVQMRASILVGNGVWIGHNCVISKGCRLADNITVSSGSVVKGRFKNPNTIIGGNPAKIWDEGFIRDDV